MSGIAGTKPPPEFVSQCLLFSPQFFLFPVQLFILPKGGEYFGCQLAKLSFGDLPRFPKPGNSLEFTVSSAGNSQHRFLRLA
jgi:hypothetical protein